MARVLSVARAGYRSHHLRIAIVKYTICFCYALHLVQKEAIRDYYILLRTPSEKWLFPIRLHGLQCLDGWIDLQLYHRIGFRTSLHLRQGHLEGSTAEGLLSNTKILVKIE